MKGEFFKRLYKNMDKEEIIRVATEDKIRADRNARLLHKTIEKNRNIVEEKDKEIERLNNIINELEKWLEEKQIERIDNVGIYALYETVLQKLQELKGSDKE